MSEAEFKGFPELAELIFDSVNSASLIIADFPKSLNLHSQVIEYDQLEVEFIVAYVPPILYSCNNHPDAAFYDKPYRLAISNIPHFLPYFGYEFSGTLRMP